MKIKNFHFENNFIFLSLVNNQIIIFMKKLLLIASSVLLFSCATNEELQNEEVSKLSEAKLEAFKKGSEEGPSGNPVTFKCGSTSYINPINVNPSYPYISNYRIIRSYSNFLFYR